MTPIEQAQDTIEQWLLIEKTSETAIVKAGHRLALAPKLAEALQRLLAFHSGYQQNSAVISTLVSALVNETFAATNGELLWATELPAGKAPYFRRALVNLIAHFKRNPA